MKLILFIIKIVYSDLNLIRVGPPIKHLTQTFSKNLFDYWYLLCGYTYFPFYGLVMKAWKWSSSLQ